MEEHAALRRRYTAAVPCSVGRQVADDQTPAEVFLNRIVRFGVVDHPYASDAVPLQMMESLAVLVAEALTCYG
jgi:hypothetical protein